jgi:hypothetical protein
VSISSFLFFFADEKGKEKNGMSACEACLRGSTGFDTPILDVRTAVYTYTCTGWSFLVSLFFFGKTQRVERLCEGAECCLVSQCKHVAEIM